RRARRAVGASSDGWRARPGPRRRAALNRALCPTVCTRLPAMSSSSRGITRPASVHRERRAELDQRVLEATESLLRDGAGFTELGVERIAGAAGIARSTFYVHFVDKADLLIRLATRATDELFAASDEWWDHDHSGGAG